MAIGATFAGDVNFAHCRWTGDAAFEGAVFQAATNFKSAQFDGDADFTGARFRGPADFMEARFGSVGFAGASFGGWASYDLATFGGDAWFWGTSWTGPLRFVRATFHQLAWFKSARFAGPAGFEHTEFASDVSFDECVFGSEVRFTDCRFSGITLFVGARFDEELEFDSAVFAKEVRFNRAEMRTHAGFGRASFAGPVWLEAVKIAGQARFDGCRFADQLYASGAVLADLWLTNTEFAQATEIGPLLAQTSLTLDGATFERQVRMRVRTNRMSAIDARFLGGAGIRANDAEIVFDGTVFGAPTSVVGSPVQGQSPSRTRVLSLRRVDVSNLTLVEVDLSACLFAGAHNLDKIRIEGRQPFGRTPLSATLAIGRLRIPLAPRRTRRQTLAEEHHWRATRRRIWLTRLAIRGWNPPAVRPPQWVAQRTEIDTVTLSPDRIAVLYRAVRKAYEDAKNEPGAADFYYGEMEMRRNAASTPPGERALLHAYWFVSGYGLRASRALLLLLAVLALHGGLFAVVGFSRLPTDDPGVDFWQGQLYALEALLLTPDRSVALTGTGRLLRISLRIAGPLLAGLALLAVRNRVKR